MFTKWKPVNKMNLKSEFSQRVIHTFSIESHTLLKQRHIIFATQCFQNDLQATQGEPTRFQLCFDQNSQPYCNKTTLLPLSYANSLSAQSWISAGNNRWGKEALFRCKDGRYFCHDLDFFVAWQKVRKINAFSALILIKYLGMDDNGINEHYM